MSKGSNQREKKFFLLRKWSKSPCQRKSFSFNGPEIVSACFCLSLPALTHAGSSLEYHLNEVSNWAWIKLLFPLSSSVPLRIHAPARTWHMPVGHVCEREVLINGQEPAWMSVQWRREMGTLLCTWHQPGVWSRMCVHTVHTRTFVCDVCIHTHTVSMWSSWTLHKTKQIKKANWHCQEVELRVCHPESLPFSDSQNLQGAVASDWKMGMPGK